MGPPPQYYFGLDLDMFIDNTRYKIFKVSYYSVVHKETQLSTSCFLYQQNVTPLPNKTFIETVSYSCTHPKKKLWFPE